MDRTCGLLARSCAHRADGTLKAPDAQLTGHAAVSESGIPVSVPPLLAIRSLVSAVEIAWAASLQGFVLESNTDLNDAQGWQAVNAVPQVVGDEQRVQVPTGSSGLFFRLRKP